MIEESRDEGPLVSLVIASTAGGQALVDCIQSFTRQGSPHELGVLIAAGGAAASDRRLVDDAQVRVLRLAHNRSIPALRAEGLRAARGRIVALTADYCRAGDGWLASVIEAHRTPEAAIGGAVENLSTGSTVDWAAYFCEYGRYMLPFAHGPSDDLPGLNVTYKRESLLEFDDLLRAGTWEPLWHWRLKAKGFGLSRNPRLVVYQGRHFTPGGFVRFRYQYSRSFAGLRFPTDRLRRWMYAAATPLLPALVLYRIAREILPKRRHRRELLRALPYLVLFSAVWGVGEAVGYIAGAGQSTSRID